MGDTAASPFVVAKNIRDAADQSSPLPEPSPPSLGTALVQCAEAVSAETERILQQVAEIQLEQRTGAVSKTQQALQNGGGPSVGLYHWQADDSQTSNCQSTTLPAKS